MPHVKGIKEGDLIWCYICGHECKCKVYSHYTRWGNLSTKPKCIHCEYGFSCGKIIKRGLNK